MKKLYICFTAAVMLVLGVNAATGILIADQTILQQKCTKCHTMRNPDNYTKSEWKYNVERMAQRAGLTSIEIQNLINLNKKK